MDLLKRTILNQSSKLLCPLEKARLKRLMAYEQKARKAGHQFIAGVDEAGRGCLAGPVVAAACIIPESFWVVGVNDSKQLTEARREEIFHILTKTSEISLGVGIVYPQEIDAINIYQASVKAMLLAIEALTVKPDYLLVDGLKLPHPNITAEKIIKGDTLSHSIAAASIAAKVTRDRLMVEEYHKQYPGYGFDRHKGYGTETHLKALKELGPCGIHRKSFQPVKDFFQLTFNF